MEDGQPFEPSERLSALRNISQRHDVVRFLHDSPAFAQPRIALISVPEPVTGRIHNLHAKQHKDNQTASQTAWIFE